MKEGQEKRRGQWSEHDSNIKEGGGGERERERRRSEENGKAR